VEARFEVPCSRFTRFLRIISLSLLQIHSIHTVPSFGIGHRALLVLTPDGAIIFDTLTFIDSETISRIRELVSGTKLTAIVMSHPHFYNSMSIWAREVGDSGTRLLVHEADRKWVPQDDLQSVEFWSGDRLPLFGKPTAKGPNGLLPHGAEAVHVGGHFEGSTVLLAQPLNSTPPFLLASDSFLPNLRKDGITAMYSFPNFVPLAPSAVLKAYKAIDPFEFEVVLGAFPGRDLVKGGKEKIRRSVEGLLRHMESEARL